MSFEDFVLDMKVDRRVEKGEHVDYDGGLLVVGDALRAVEQTAPGYFVNLVTHGNHGHPSDYLHDAVRDDSDDVRIEYVERCGCGGYVTRVHVEG